ncbi:hypothetical protein MMC28_004979 [Mycoblastus sanguinarius]|nr:hypothetical protein [Mycoblastus sanguinarius]
MLYLMALNAVILLIFVLVSLGTAVQSAPNGGLQLDSPYFPNSTNTTSTPTPTITAPDAAVTDGVHWYDTVVVKVWISILSVFSIFSAAIGLIYLFGRNVSLYHCQTAKVGAKGFQRASHIA